MYAELFPGFGEAEGIHSMAMRMHIYLETLQNNVKLAVCCFKLLWKDREQNNWQAVWVNQGRHHKGGNVQIIS